MKEGGVTYGPAWNNNNVTQDIRDASNFSAGGFSDADGRPSDSDSEGLGLGFGVELGLNGYKGQAFCSIVVLNVQALVAVQASALSLQPIV